MAKETNQPLFRDINADDPDPESTEIQSLCVSCGENGITRLLLTKIPFYKEVIIMSFECEHCGFSNNELQSGGKIQEKGIKLTLQIQDVNDLNRQVVKTDSTSVRIPCLEFEIPAFSQKGEVTTIEGIIDRSITGLEQDQVSRRREHPDAAAQIDAFLVKLKKLKDVDTPFEIILEDVNGNCFIENPNAPQVDHRVQTSYFSRTKEQNNSLGLFEENEIFAEGVPLINDDAAKAETVSTKAVSDHGKEVKGVLGNSPSGPFTLEGLEGEVLQFPTNCPSCGAPCTTNMKMTNIPYFKEVVIMATTCDACGERTNEVKSGGGIEPKGLRIEVRVSGREDFSRDVLKSETCTLKIPELDVEVGAAALGGRFSTVEGILSAMAEQLADNSRIWHDSAHPDAAKHLEEFMDKFRKVLEGTFPVTLVLDDPAGNSYVQSFTAPDPDCGLKVTTYERTFEQNEELGLNDMKVEGYEINETSE